MCIVWEIAYTPHFSGLIGVYDSVCVFVLIHRLILLSDRCIWSVFRIIACTLMCSRDEKSATSASNFLLANSRVLWTIGALAVSFLWTIRSRVKPIQILIDAAVCEGRCNVLEPSDFLWTLILVWSGPSSQCWPTTLVSWRLFCIHIVMCLPLHRFTRWDNLAPRVCIMVFLVKCLGMAYDHVEYRLAIGLEFTVWHVDDGVVCHIRHSWRKALWLLYKGDGDDAPRKRSLGTSWQRMGSVV